MTIQQFLAWAEECGLMIPVIVPPFALPPRQKPFSHGLIGDPALILPQARSMVALLHPYQPFLAEEGGPTLSAYYLASHRLYSLCKDLLARCEAENTPLVPAPFPAKAMLEAVGVASIGRHTLSMMKGQGSRYAVEWFLSPCWDPQPIPFKPALACGHCHACIDACPGHAIQEDGFVLDRCLRFHMESAPFPDWVKQRLPGLTGCEICQAVCPRCASVSALPIPDPIRSLYSYDAILHTDHPQWQSMQRERQKLMGKNMMRKQRLLSQAFVLAANASNASFVSEAKNGVLSDNAQLADASAYYLQKISP